MKQTSQSAVDGTERTNTTPSANSEATNRVGWTDLSDRTTPSEATAVADESPPVDELPSSVANSAAGRTTIPAALPEPEVTLYSDTTTVIRFLRKQRVDDQFELRLYQADNQSVAHIIPDESTGFNSRKNGRVEALPEAARRRFEHAVDAVSEQFSLSTVNSDNSYGQCCHRRPHHGFCGVLEFRVTLQAEEPKQNQ